MASIILKEGSLESSSWNLGHWKDNEVSYSNVAGGKNKQFSIKADWNELNSILLPPAQRLMGSSKKHLPGYKGNEYEVLPRNRRRRGRRY